MPSLAMVGMIPLMMGIGAFAIDMMHANTVKGELLKAADAGALAGAKELINWNGGAGQPIIEARARTVTGLNIADGKTVASTSPQTTVTAAVITPPTSPNGAGGVVRVEAEMTTGNLWAQVFAQAAQTFGCTADATCAGIANTGPGGTYPLAIEINTNGPGGDALASKTINDNLRLGWGQNVKWTGWGSMGSNANDVGTLQSDFGVGNINESVAAKGQTDPGTMLNTTNGVQASNIGDLAGRIGQVIVMPVITDTSNEVISFVAYRIVSVTVNGANSVVDGTIVAGPASGTGNHQPNAGVYNTWISRNEPVKVRLVQ